MRSNENQIVSDPIDFTDDSLNDVTTPRLPDPTVIHDGELSKSSKTRLRIMKAAVGVLDEYGYVGTTTTTVAEHAGITRGAMLYHFGSRLSLIEATIHFVLRSRIAMYQSAMSEIEKDDDYYGHMIDIAWEQLNTPEFRAFSELAGASRSDAELAEIFVPALKEFDRARKESALAIFPPHLTNTPVFDLRRDIVRFLLEGLAQQGGLAFDAEVREVRILEFLKVLAARPEGANLLSAALKQSQSRLKLSSNKEKGRPFGRPKKKLDSRRPKGRRS